MFADLAFGWRCPEDESGDPESIEYCCHVPDALLDNEPLMRILWGHVCQSVHPDTPKDRTWDDFWAKNCTFKADRLVSDSWCLELDVSPAVWWSVATAISDREVSSAADQQWRRRRWGPDFNASPDDF
jgi:hypothetical protein